MERNLDFADAAAIFEGPVLQFEDERFDYGETRMVAVGYRHERMMIVIWTPRGADRHVFSMRKADDREQRRYGPFFLSWSAIQISPRSMRT